VREALERRDERHVSPPLTAYYTVPAGVGSGLRQFAIPSPVALGPDPHAWGIDEVLLNLGDEVPQDFYRFARLIEIVSNDDHGRAQARVRWKHYKGLGYELQQHDLSKAADT
jgi:hypothetical protein